MTMMLSSTVHCPRTNKPTESYHYYYHGKASRQNWYVLFAVFAILIQRGHIQVKAECHAHGCSLTAVDIFYDEFAKEALSVLRQTESEVEIEANTIINNDSRETALSALQPAGDDSKTAMTLRGYKGGEAEDQVNQDRAMVVSPFLPFPNDDDNDDDDDDSSSKQSKEPNPVVTAQLLGVFDGHGGGGEKTSQYALENVPSLLAAKLASIVGGGGKSDGDGDSDSDSDDQGRSPQQQQMESQVVVEALKQTFNEVDKNDPSLGTAGCTATVVLRLGQKLFIANAGDSVSFVGVYFGGPSSLSNNVQIVYQSREDKPDLPDEKARIDAMGGYVHIPPNDDDDVPRAYYIDENRQAQYGLAMSRSLGDWEVQGVIAEPIVDVLDLNEIVQKALASYTESCNTHDVDNIKENANNDKDRYCELKDSSDIHIFATSLSDGMIDYLSLEDIGNHLATAFFDQESNLHPHSAAEKLIVDAANGWENEFRGEYRDDIAIASFAVPYL